MCKNMTPCVYSPKPSNFLNTIYVFESFSIKNIINIEKQNVAGVKTQCHFSLSLKTSRYLCLHLHTILESKTQKSKTSSENKLSGIDILQ